LDNYRFWRNQWRDHGTCSSLPLNPYGYFYLAAHIKNKIKLDRLLTNAKIVAHGTNTYKKTLFNSTIFAGIGAYPQLTCERNKQGSHDLLEIRVCLDKKGLSYQNCTEPSNSCGQDIILPL